jgi:MFS family permease
MAPGRGRRVFLSGLGLFTACSLLGYAAQNGGELIAARAAQGVGGAILAPAWVPARTTATCQERLSSSTGIVRMPAVCRA